MSSASDRLSEAVHRLQTPLGAACRAYAPQTAHILRCWLIRSRGRSYDSLVISRFKEENHGHFFPALPSPTGNQAGSVDPQILPHVERSAATPPTPAPVTRYPHHRPVCHPGRSAGLARDRNLWPETPRLAAPLLGFA